MRPFNLPRRQHFVCVATFIIVITVGVIVINITGLHYGVTSVPFDVNNQDIPRVSPRGDKQDDEDVTPTNITVKLLSKETDHTFIKQRFEQRRLLLQRMCKNETLNNPMASNDEFKERLKKIVHEKLVWCPVPKVGTTFIKYNLIPEIEEVVNRYPEIKLRASGRSLPSFLLVRDPYSRLVSGYIDKVRMAPSWWDKLATNIQLKVTTPEINCKNKITFAQFVKYFVESEKSREKRNIHFIPQHELCNVCSYNFDFIGHLETLSEDIEYILRSVGVESTVDTDITEKQIMTRAIQTLDKDRKTVQKCRGVLPFMKELWWSFQARGYISTSVPFPFHNGEGSYITGKRFGEIALNGYFISKDKFDKRDQKRRVVSSLYSQLPNDLRQELQRILRTDCKLFGYDVQPSHIFHDV